MKKQPAAGTAEKLTFTERFSYSLGSLACNLIWTAMGSFMVIFYTDIALLPAALVGTMILISRVFDGFSDIVMGTIIDRTKSKKGKARPWLLRMAIPFGIAAVLVFTVPDWELTGRIIYAFLTYNLMTTIMYTAVDMPYGVLNSTMSRDQYQRSVLNIFRLFMAIVAGVLVNFTVLPLTRAFGGGARGWQLTFAVFGALAALLFLITYKNTKERNSQSTVKKDAVPLKTALKSLFKNKYWLFITIFAVLSYTSSSLNGAVTVYYCRDILGNADLVGTLSAFGVLPMVLGTFLIAPLVKRYGKRNTVLAGVITGAVGAVIMLFAGSNLLIIFASMVFKGIGSAFVIGNLFAMISDTIEYGHWKTGVRTEGLVYSASSFGGKLGNGLGTAILGLALSVGGYSAALSAQPQSALVATEVMFLYMPLILSALMAVMLVFYRLDKEYPAIMADLSAGKTVMGPITEGEAL